MKKDDKKFYNYMVLTLIVVVLLLILTLAMAMPNSYNKIQEKEMAEEVENTLIVPADNMEEPVIGIDGAIELK